MKNVWRKYIRYVKTESEHIIFIIIYTIRRWEPHILLFKSTHEFWHVSVKTWMMRLNSLFYTPSSTTEWLFNIMNTEMKCWPSKLIRKYSAFVVFQSCQYCFHLYYTTVLNLCRQQCVIIEFQYCWHLFYTLNTDILKTYGWFTMQL